MKRTVISAFMLVYVFTIVNSQCNPSLISNGPNLMNTILDQRISYTNQITQYTMKSFQNETKFVAVNNSFVSDPDFWVSIGANVLGTGLFISRVHLPEQAKWFGYGSQLLGIPSLALGISDIVKRDTDFNTWANFAYASWAIYSSTVDYILRTEYRDPLKPGIMVPYVVTYYIGIGTQSAAQYWKAKLPWIIAGVACLINVGASFYARGMGAD